MRKSLIFSVLGFVFLLLISDAMGAEEETFFFYGYLPEKFPKSFISMPLVFPGEIRFRQIQVEIPQMKKIEQFNFIYTEYLGILPKDWSGMTMIWNDGQSFWPLYVHIAIKGNAGLDTIYQQGYCIGFLKALVDSGVDLSEIKGKWDRRFYFKKKEWKMTQLEDALSNVGMIRGAFREMKSEKIKINFNQIMRSKDKEGRHDLTKLLIKKAQKNPSRFISLVGDAVGAFLKEIKKEEKLPERLPKNFKWKMMTASR